MIINGPASSLPFPPFLQRFPLIGADLKTLLNTISSLLIILYTLPKINYLQPIYKLYRQMDKVSGHPNSM